MFNSVSSFSFISLTNKNQKPSVETQGTIASAQPSVFRPSASVETFGSMASAGSSAGSSCGSSSGSFSAVA